MGPNDCMYLCRIPVSINVYDVQADVLNFVEGKLLIVRNFWIEEQLFELILFHRSIDTVPGEYIADDPSICETTIFIQRTHTNRFSKYIYLVFLIIVENRTAQRHGWFSASHKGLNKSPLCAGSNRWIMPRYKGMDDPTYLIKAWINAWIGV